MTSIDDDRDPQAQRLERMKNDFLVAQRGGVARGRLEPLRVATTLVMGQLWRALPPMVLTGIVALRP